MIVLNKREFWALVNDYNMYFGEGGISRTYSHNHKYYLCESEKNKKILRDYYKKIGLDPKDVDKRCFGSR